MHQSRMQTMKDWAWENVIEQQHGESWQARGGVSEVTGWHIRSNPPYARYAQSGVHKAVPTVGGEGHN